MGRRQPSHTTFGVQQRSEVHRHMKARHMNTRRRLVLSATTLAVAFLASTVGVTGVGATVPPTTPTPEPTTDRSQNGDPQIVESWTLAPAASDDPNQSGNRSDLTYVADAGAVIQDAVTLYNVGNVPLTFRVYSTDAFNDEQGQFALLAGDKTPVDVGTWVTFPQEALTVMPGQQATMPISVKIPADASPGDHAGAILASSPTLGTGKQGEVVTLDRRTGTRLYVRVNGDLVPSLAVDDVTTDYDQAVNPLGGSATVTFRVSNRGNIRLSGTPTVSVGGPFGLFEKKVTLPGITELLPGEDVTVTAELADVAATMFDFTTVRVDPHGVANAGTLRGPVGKDKIFAPPMTLLVALLIAVVGLLVVRRRRRTAGRYAAAVVDLGTLREREPQHQST